MTVNMKRSRVTGRFVRTLRSNPDSKEWPGGPDKYNRALRAAQDKASEARFKWGEAMYRKKDRKTIATALRQVKYWERKVIQLREDYLRK